MSIKIDDVPISQYNLKCELNHDHPALPGTRDYTEEIPGMHGAYDYGADMGVRTFHLPMKLQSVNSNNQLALAMREFIKILVDSTGRPKTVKLSFEYEPEKWYMVRYSGSLPLQRLIHRGLFTLPLTAFVPYAYAESTAYSDNPLKVVWNTNGMVVTLINHSPIETPIQMRIRGSVLNPKVTNLTTYKSIQVNEQFTTTLGDLIVDSHNFTVQRIKKDNEIYFLSGSFPAKTSEVITKANLLSRYVGDFIFLVPGENTLYFEGTNINTNIYFDWKHRFL
jgi:phage-related protein